MVYGGYMGENELRNFSINCNLEPRYSKYAKFFHKHGLWRSMPFRNRTLLKDLPFFLYQKLDKHCGYFLEVRQNCDIF